MMNSPWWRSSWKKQWWNNTPLSDWLLATLWIVDGFYKSLIVLTVTTRRIFVNRMCVDVLHEKGYMRRQNWTGHPYRVSDVMWCDVCALRYPWDDRAPTRDLPSSSSPSSPSWSGRCGSQHRAIGSKRGHRVVYVSTAQLLNHRVVSLSEV